MIRSSAHNTMQRRLKDRNDNYQSSTSTTPKNNILAVTPRPLHIQTSPRGYAAPLPCGHLPHKREWGLRAAGGAPTAAYRARQSPFKLTAISNRSPGLHDPAYDLCTSVNKESADGEETPKASIGQTTQRSKLGARFKGNKDLQRTRRKAPECRPDRGPSERCLWGETTPRAPPSLVR